MKILFVSPTFYPAVAWGGPIFAVYNLCNHLSRLSEMDLSVITTDSAGSEVDQAVLGKEQNETQKAGGYPIKYCKRIFGASTSWELLKVLRKNIKSTDLIHLTAVFSFPTIPTLFLAKVYKKKVVWSPRGALGEWEIRKNKLIKLIWLKICSILVVDSSIILHCTSIKEREESKTKVNNVVKTVIIPNGIVFPERKKRYVKRNDGLNLIFIGLISPKKGVENLIEAMKFLINRNVFLSVYGESPFGFKGYDEMLKVKVKEYGLEKIVEFKGFVDQKQKERAFLNADVCVVPSYSENFCNVVAEALSYEVPVIVSKGVPWGRIEEKCCGLWINNTPSSLVDAISEMRSMNLKDMGARGRKWMQEEYGWETVAARFKDFYIEFGRR